MKYLFFSLACFSFASSSAQNFETGLDGGITYNNVLKNAAWYSSDVLSLMPRRLPQTPVYAVKGMYLHHKWQYGLSIERQQLAYINSYRIPTPLPFTPDDGWYLPYITFKNASYYPVSLFVNRRITCGHFENYGGITVGYILIPNINGYNYNLQKESFSPVSANRDPFNKNGYYGLTAGLQIGSTWFITKRFGINAEVRATYMYFREGTQVISSFITIPATLGIRYKI